MVGGGGDLTVQSPLSCLKLHHVSHETFLIIPHLTRICRVISLIFGPQYSTIIHMTSKDFTRLHNNPDYSVILHNTPHIIT